MNECDHVVAYNGYTDFVDAVVKFSGVAESVELIKEGMSDFVNSEFGIPSIKNKVEQKLKAGSNQVILQEKYAISKYCPECGEKIEWEINET